MIISASRGTLHGILLVVARLVEHVFSVTLFFFLAEADGV